MDAAASIPIPAEHPAAPPAAGPACPRCGYDQSGLLATWSVSCPLSGVCSECGFVIDWRDLLNPVFTHQGRLFEHAHRRLGRAFFAAWWRALVPSAFWRWISITHPVVPARIAAFVPLGFAATYSAFLGLIAAVAAAILLVATLGGGAAALGRYWSREVMQRALFPIRTEYVFMSDRVPPGIWIMLLTLAIMPAAFLALPVSLRRARVRRIHLLRIWAYGFVTLPAVFLLPVAIQALARFTDTACSIFTPRFSALLTSQLEPWHSESITGLGFVWTFLWWTAAAGRYLKLPTPAAVGLAMSVLSTLLAVAVICAFPGGATWLMLNM
jgi:hypothetical protein